MTVTSMVGEGMSSVVTLHGRTRRRMGRKCPYRRHRVLPKHPTESAPERPSAASRSGRPARDGADRAATQGQGPPRTRDAEADRPAQKFRRHQRQQNPQSGEFIEADAAERRTTCRSNAAPHGGQTRHRRARQPAPHPAKGLDGTPAHTPRPRTQRFR
jgi:hypothetical protein